MSNETSTIKSPHFTIAFDDQTCRAARKSMEIPRITWTLSTGTSSNSMAFFFSKPCLRPALASIGHDLTVSKDDVPCTKQRFVKPHIAAWASDPFTDQNELRKKGFVESGSCVFQFLPSQSNVDNQYSSAYCIESRIYRTLWNKRQPLGHLISSCLMYGTSPNFGSIMIMNNDG